MTFATEVTAALLEGRRLAESLMIDTCTVQRVTGHTPNEDGTVTDVLGEPVYTGRCKVQTYEPYQSNPEAGGATFTVQRYAVHVPVGSFAPAVDQVVVIAAATLDPYLAGRRFRVVALLHKSAATAYRLAVEEVS